MNYYMADISLPEIMTEEFLKLIPQQRARINELMSQGKIQSYSLALDRSHLWVIFAAESLAKVWKMIDSFPLVAYLEPEIHDLAFHNSLQIALPTVSMN